MIGAGLHIICGASHPDERVEEILGELRASQGYDPGPMGGCGRTMLWPYAYRCVTCGRWFHRECIRRHFAATQDDVRASGNPPAPILAC